ncbi:MAG: SPASM domain-containing protein [Myxococcota bacterium]
MSMQQAKLIQDIRMYLSRTLTTGWAPPDRLSLNLTLRCNLSCTMCTTCYDAPELHLEEIKRLIDEAAEWGIEVFNPLGGEPFMRSDIEAILRYATQRGFYVTLTTNGTLISPSRAHQLALVPSDRLHLNFSLDGNAASNDRVRGEGAYNKAIRGYHNVRQADSAIGNSHRKILSNTILHAGNFDHFEAILEEQESLGFDGIQILNLFRSSEPLQDSPAHFMWFTDAQIPALERLCERLAQRADQAEGSGFRIQNSAEELRYISKYYTEDLTPLEAPCWAGWKELYINADGQAIMCDGKLDFLNGGFGNVRTQSLKELWASPELKARRQTVKKCRTPCIQNCYLRPQSDSAIPLFKRSMQILNRKISPHLAFTRPETHIQNGVLRLELSDVMPGDYEGRQSPIQRWQELTQACPERPNAHNWTDFRDSGKVDFGRGFMGFEIVRHVIAELQASGLRFETIAVGWRGDSLLHPEVVPILHVLASAIHSGLAQRLRVETTGLFIRPEIADVASQDLPQDWILDWDYGNGSGISELEAVAGPQTRIILRQRAMSGVDYSQVKNRFPQYETVVGYYPKTGMRCHWIIREEHGHFLGDSNANLALTHAAEWAGVSFSPVDTAQPCRAPERSVVISWDAKVTLCEHDIQLKNRVGEIDSEPLLSIWNRMAQDRQSAKVHGRPQRSLCHQCGYLWSPSAV